jgi:fucose permease
MSASEAATLPAVHVRLALTVLCATFFVAGFVQAALGPVLPDLARRTGGSLEMMGGVVSAVFVGALGAQFVAGRASDRHGRRVVLAVCLALYAAGVAAVAASTSPWLSLAIATFTGFGYGSVSLSCNVLAAELVPARRASSVNLVNTFYALGSVAGPLAVSLLLERGAQALTALWIGAVFLAVCGGVSAIALPDHLPAVADGTGAAGGPAREARLRDPLLFACGLCLLIYVGSEVGFGAWCSEYLQRSTGMDAARGAAAAAMFWGGLTAGRVGAVAAGMHVSSERLMNASVWLSAAGALLLWLGHGAVAPSLVAVVLIGLGFGPIYPTAVAVITSHFPQAAGKATSSMGILVAVGGALLPWVHGRVLAHRPTADSALFTLLSVAAMWLIWEWTRRLAHRPRATAGRETHASK